MSIGPVSLPELEFVATDACGTRGGATVRLVVVHRWGVRFTSMRDEANSYQGVINEFKNKANDASSHVVYPGSAVGGGNVATQMVPWHLKAWTEAFYNPQSVEVESADAIWLGHDPYGMHVLARITAFLLHHYNLPPVPLDAHGVLHGRGFCRHGDLGKLGGGHTACPTTSISLWHAFSHLVEHEHHVGGFRHVWGTA